MSRRLYSLLFILLAPVFWAVMALRARRAKQPWDIFSAERFGFPTASSSGGVNNPRAVPARASANALVDTHNSDPARVSSDAAANAPQDAALIWVHAVSLGETRASHSLVSALLDRGFRVLLTHMTATGRAEGRHLYGPQIAAGQLIQTWVPYDFPSATRRFFEAYRPALGILIEREIWPNLVHACTARSIPLALVSARFSASALKQSQRPWMAPLLRASLASISPVLCQTQGDADRLSAAGACDPLVLGNLKFDVSVAASTPPAVTEIKRSDPRSVVAVASTREGEDRMFITALLAQREKNHWTGGGASAALAGTSESIKKVDGIGTSESIEKSEGIARVEARALGEAGFLTLLIPRHPQRFESAFEMAQAAELTVYRRSATGWQVPADANVLIGDSLGEMAHYLGLADVAIIGGSFAPLGGQNFIEACALGVPVIVGPHTRNFEPAAQDAIEAGAVLRASSAAHALDLAQTLLADSAQRAAMASAGRAWVAQHVGATDRILAALPLPGVVPRHR